MEFQLTHMQVSLTSIDKKIIIIYYRKMEFAIDSGVISIDSGVIRILLICILVIDIIIQKKQS